MSAAPGEQDGTPLSHDGLRPGARLGRYELLVPVATGGMARVWAARQHGQRGFTKIVAIKTILPHLAREPEFERMFLDEARIAAGVHHPNVCEIYELGEEGTVLYLAMEWVTGDALVHVLRGGVEKERGQPRPREEPLDPRTAARVVADAAAGLHAAHNLTDDLGQPLGVVHRDVSPHNILISADGNVKVADFGVAKALGQVHQATTAKQLRGKLAYMSPEQVASGHVDRRSDVFSLGCVLYEATTGRPPFVGESEPQLLSAVSRGLFPAPNELVPSFPDELAQIVLRAMARDPIQRFPTAERMRMALEEWLARSGPIVTQSQVGAALQQRIGAVIERRRDKIRTATQGLRGGDSMTPAPGPVSGSSSGVQPAPAASLSLASYSEPPPAASGSSSGVQPSPYAREDAPASSAPPASAQPSSRPIAADTSSGYLLAVGIGVGVALVIGVGGFIALAAAQRQQQRTPPAVPAIVQPSAAPAASTPPAGP